MIPDASEQPLLTVDELLQAVPRWPHGRSGTYEAMRRGDLPSVRIGRRLFIPTAPLRQMLGLGDVPASSTSTRNEAPASTGGASHYPFAAPDTQVRRRDE